MEGSDICFAPVLSMEEAPSHPHNSIAEASSRTGRSVAAWAGAALQPYTEQYLSVRRPPRDSIPRKHLRDWGFANADLESLRKCGAIAKPA